MVLTSKDFLDNIVIHWHILIEERQWKTRINSFFLMKQLRSDRECGRGKIRARWLLVEARCGRDGEVLVFNRLFLCWVSLDSKRFNFNSKDVHWRHLASFKASWHAAVPAAGDWTSVCWRRMRGSPVTLLKACDKTRRADWRRAGKFAVSPFPAHQFSKVVIYTGKVL